MEPVAAADVDVSSVDVPKAPPPAVVPVVQATSAAPPPPSAAPHAPLVDIAVPYSPPAAGDDSDSEFELHVPRVKQAKAKVAKPKPSAPKASAEVGEPVESSMPPAAAPVPAAAAPAPERIALAPVASNVPPAAAAAKPRAPAPPGGVKKRKLLDVSTAVDTVPPAFLFGLMGGGGFTAPKLKPAF